MNWLIVSKNTRLPMTGTEIKHRKYDGARKIQLHIPVKIGTKPKTQFSCREIVVKREYLIPLC